MTAIQKLNAPHFQDHRNWRFYLTRYMDGTLCLRAGTTVAKDGYMAEEMVTCSTEIPNRIGLTAQPRCVYIADYSTHEGLADAIAQAGVAVKLGQVSFGIDHGWMVRVSDTVEER